MIVNLFLYVTFVAEKRNRFLASLHALGISDIINNTPWRGSEGGNKRSERNVFIFLSRFEDTH